MSICVIINNNLLNKLNNLYNNFILVDQNEHNKQKDMNCICAIHVMSPLCLMRYLPRTMRRQSRMKTMTATTPPITARSPPEEAIAMGSG